MNDGFTGMNPEQVAREIREFQEAIRDVSLKFSMAGGKFFEDLDKSWWSPKAVEFSSQYSAKLYENTVGTLEMLSDQIVGRTIEAYREMASENGLPYSPDMFDYSGVRPEIQGTFGWLRESNGGSVGMNVQSVLVALDEFKERYENGLVQLDSLPRTISFFDTNDSMKTAYAVAISMMQRNVREVTSEITSSIYEAVNEEGNKISHSVDSAVESMGGGSSGFSGPYGGGNNTHSVYNPGDSVYNPGGQTYEAPQQQPPVAHGAPGSSGVGFGGYGAGSDSDY